MRPRARSPRPYARRPLIYPALDLRGDCPRARNSASISPSPRHDRLVLRPLFRARLAVTDPRAIPALYEDYTGLPPALILTAGHDPLRDEGADYAKTLEAAGVPVEYACYEGTIHGFMNMGRVRRGARMAMRASVLPTGWRRACTTFSRDAAASTSTSCVGRGNDDVRAGFASSEHGSVVATSLAVASPGGALPCPDRRRCRGAKGS